MTNAVASRPEDFSVQYEWRAGSMPPPYHYEYTIHLGPGPQAKIIFQPDYSMEGVPVWTETFAITAKDLDDLYAAMAEREMFRDDWAEQENPPIGGSSAWLTATAHGKQVRVPSQLIDSERVQPVYDTIKALVPQEIWDRLMTQRDQYEQTYREPTT